MCRSNISFQNSKFIENGLLYDEVMQSRTKASVSRSLTQEFVKRDLQMNKTDRRSAKVTG